MSGGAPQTIPALGGERRMDAIEMLKADHEKVKGLYQQYQSTEDKRQKKKIAQQVIQELEVHAALEEEIFYPAVKRKADEEGKSQVAEAVEEHHVVHVLIGELKEMNTLNERYEAKFKVLMEGVEHHVEEEEGEMLPHAKEILGSDIEKLSTRMEKRKQELMATQS
jgi:hemerythrin superfamily protein